MTDITKARAPHASKVRLHATPALVRLAFGVLERHAPGLGAFWAERIWFTIPRAGHRVSTGLPPGQTSTVDFDGRSVTGQIWGNGPTVYLVHGWAGFVGHLAAFVAPLVERGYRVVAFDARAMAPPALAGTGRDRPACPSSSRPLPRWSVHMGPRTHS